MQSKVKISTQDRHEDTNPQFFRVVTPSSFSYLVGQLKELVEATTSSESQAKSLKNVMADKLYDWWNSHGDKLTPEEFEEASKKHWDSLKEEA